MERRFVGTRVRNTAREKLAYVLVLAGFVVFAAIHFPPLAAIPIIKTANSALGGVGGAAVFVAVGVLALVIAFRIGGKKLVLSVTAGGVTVDPSPGEVFALHDAKMGRWTSRGRGPAGRALFLTSGAHRYVLGALDGRLTGEVPPGGPEVEARHLDAWLSPQPFDELLAIAGLHSELPPQARRSAPWVTRGVLLLVFVVALGFLMPSTFSGVYQYTVGTPTTATVSQCGRSTDTTRTVCTATWTVNGQTQSGPLLTHHTVAGSTLSVHVRDGKAIASVPMREPYIVCGVWAVLLIASCAMIIYGIRTRRASQIT